MCWKKFNEGISFADPRGGGASASHKHAGQSRHNNTREGRGSKMKKGISFADANEEGD